MAGPTKAWAVVDADGRIVKLYADAHWAETGASAYEREHGDAEARQVRTTKAEQARLATSWSPCIEAIPARRKP